MLQVGEVGEIEVLCVLDVHPRGAAEVGSVALFVDLLVEVYFGVGELIVNWGGETADFPVADDGFGVFSSHCVGDIVNDRDEVMKKMTLKLRVVVTRMETVVVNLSSVEYYELRL